MNKRNQLKALVGTLSLLLVVMVVSCTRNLSVPITAVVVTSTPSMTATNTVPAVTFTFTNTFTPSPTATNTQPVITYTFTNTFTVTDTPTITNTPTVTATPTNTLPPNTSTVTNTPTLTGTPTNTPTVTNTVPAPPTATPNIPTGNSEMWDDFSEAPWTGWTAPSYLVSTYVSSCTINSGAQNTTTTQAGVAGSLDYNVTFTAATGNLLELTIENGVSYGNTENELIGGNNPSAVALWIQPVQTAMAVAKVWIDTGTNYDVVNTTALPAGQWTYIYATTASMGVPAGAMSTTKAVIIDLTCPTASTVDVLYDNIYFFQ